MNNLNKETVGLKSEGIGTFVAVVVLLVIIFFTFTYMIFFSDGETSQTNTVESSMPDKYEMYAQGQRFVLQALKAPSTAKFPPLAFEVSTDGNRLYRVISYVDSQNSFGAMIRDNWSVTMRVVEGKWILELMVIGDEIVYDIGQ